MAGPVPIGVLTVSDRASRGIYEDKGGPAIEAALRELADAEACVTFRPKGA